MSLLAPLCQQLKQQFTPKHHSPEKSVKYWREKDRLDNTITDAFVILLTTRGCTWAHSGGCSMCGYYTDSNWKEISETHITTQFQTAMQHYQNEPIIKIFNSGSFLDQQEIPQKLQHSILTSLDKKAKKINIESRPEYITPQKIQTLNNTLTSPKLEIGIGLETANDFIRKHAINKGFCLKDYQKAATLLSEKEIGVKTYLLIKPPLLTEQEAIDDAINSVQIIKDISTTISFNPCNVQRYTPVEYLWRRHYYRPPWFWSIIDILKKSKQQTTTRLQCDISGGGSPRGAHNCRECDQINLDSIKQFSLTQDPKYLNNGDCTCKPKWKTQCQNENKSFGSLIDYQKEFR